MLKAGFKCVEGSQVPLLFYLSSQPQASLIKLTQDPNADIITHYTKSTLALCFIRSGNEELPQLQCKHKRRPPKKYSWWSSSSSNIMYTNIHQCTCRDLCCDSNSLPLPKGMKPCGVDYTGGWRGRRHRRHHCTIPLLELPFAT